MSHLQCYNNYHSYGVTNVKHGILNNFHKYDQSTTNLGVSSHTYNKKYK